MLKQTHSINAEIAVQAHKRDVKVQKVCGSGFFLLVGSMLA